MKHLSVTTTADGRGVLNETTGGQDATDGMTSCQDTAVTIGRQGAEKDAGDQSSDKVISNCEGTDITGTIDPVCILKRKT